ADDVQDHKEALQNHAWGADHARDCLSDYQWLHDHGVADTDTIHFDSALKTAGLPAGTHSLAEIHDGCARAQRKRDATAAARSCMATAKEVAEEPTADHAQYGSGEARLRDAQEWLAALAGVDAGDTFPLDDHDASFGDARKACDAYVAWSKRLAQATAADDAAKAKAREAKYTSVGVGGEKLKLFLEYDDVYWRTSPKCETEDDPKQLAKAKQLFQWLDNADGTVTIRKYQFAGNKVAKISNKTFTTAEKAYKGCK
ncbi:MAG TPA: hypothetical protein VL463_07315, partial [Kofleriaceae bacterium]|nr:hypothetical protein [Kofleriaceae bacterium]